MTERKTLLGGRYELDQIIGRGGMAEVWRARDTRLERDVAVKRLRLDLASDPTFQARFRREAHSAAGLNHPNIVAVYDTGEELDPNSDVAVPYIVMELVEGVTLRDVLRDGRKVVPARALEFTAGVLDALAYSHRAGIIHRDIKPANVMLTPSGSVKVMDFGIARAVADTSATMTQTAAVIGTAQYLSPEQARGEKVDNRSDLYSVGCLLYELLTSQPPFTGDSPVSVAYQHVREQPVPPSQVDPEVTPDMDAVVLKALAKDRNDRYQDAREFREDVIRAMNGQPVRAALASGEDAVATAVMTPAAAAAQGVTTTTPQRAVSPAHPGSPVDEEEEEEEGKKSKTGVIVLSVLAGLVLIAVGVALFMIYGTGEPDPELRAVPSVIGEEESSAITILEDADFDVRVEQTAGEEDDEGYVLEQDPLPQEMHEVGSTVTIWVSTGADTLTIPGNLIGMPVDQAISALEDEGFTREQIIVEDADPANENIDRNEGEVDSVNPGSGGTILRTESVTLYVATGESIVPSIEGMTRGTAEATARQAGFEVDFTEEQTSDYSPGVTFDQSPSSGESLSRGERIEVNIAVAVPDLVPRFIGLTEAEADIVAREYGYILDFNRVTTNEQPEGRIFAQEPSEGEPLERGSTVAVDIAVAEEEPDPTPPTSPSPSPEPTETPTEDNGED